MKPNPIIWAVTVMVTVTTIGAVWLIAIGKDITSLLAFYGVVLAPVIAGFLGHVITSLKEVKTQTNGNTTAMQEALIQIAKQQTPNGSAPPVEVTNHDAG